jgi:hypothetical protein
MGDRATVMLKGSDNHAAEIVLYTHWSGTGIEKVVAAGLKKAIDGGRETDQPYAQRIIAQTFFDAHGDTSTGAGLWVGIDHSEDHQVTVDFDEQTVTYDPQSRECGTEGEDPITSSFVEFVAAFPADEPAKV